MSNKNKKNIEETTNIGITMKNVPKNKVPKVVEDIAKLKDKVGASGGVSIVVGEEVGKKINSNTTKKNISGGKK